jgi:amino acid adenylation domain-containing protein
MQRRMEEAPGGAAPGDLPVVLSMDGCPDARVGAAAPWMVHRFGEGPGGLVLDWDGVDAVFPPGMLDDLVAGHVELLVALADERDAWDRTAADLLPERQRRAREVVNATSQPLPSWLLHELFWDQAACAPDRTAVIAEDRTLTYGELRAGASALAGRLRALGARPGRMVAVVSEKGWEQPLAVLGVLQAGAPYVPVAPDLPAERFQHLLRHAEVELAVVAAGRADALPWPPGVRPVPVDPGLLAGDGSQPPDRSRGHRDLAYLIYTSGSTGQPKGVMIDHRGAVNTILDINRRFRVGPGDRVLALSSLSFDLSVYDIFGLLAAGGAIVIPPEGAGRAPWCWQDLMAEHRVTVWDTVPALMEMLVTHASGRGERLAPSLRLVMMSGDWIPVSLPGRIRAPAATGIEIIGMGGATEASIWSNAYVIAEPDPAWPSIPYGRPLGNQLFEVLDATLRRRPDWVPGELHIGGAGVAMGYWRDEERTRRSFITHPRTGERLYRTGDLGRYLPDGNLEFLGREDLQVKVQGFRIELGEIESALLGHDGVAAAVVTATGDPRGERRLVACVTRTGACGAPAAADRDEFARLVRDHLRARLPAYMVPARVVVLDALPLTANGKVDRTALPVE